MAGKPAAHISNRQQAQVPRGKRFWCGGCDANLVWAGQKCKVCGYSGPDGKKNRLKPTARHLIPKE